MEDDRPMFAILEKGRLVDGLWNDGDAALHLRRHPNRSAVLTTWGEWQKVWQSVSQEWPHDDVREDWNV